LVRVPLQGVQTDDSAFIGPRHEEVSEGGKNIHTRRGVFKGRSLKKTGISFFTKEILGGGNKPRRKNSPQTDQRRCLQRTNPSQEKRIMTGGGTTKEFITPVIHKKFDGEGEKVTYLSGKGGKKSIKESQPRTAKRDNF